MCHGPRVMGSRAKHFHCKFNDVVWQMRPHYTTVSEQGMGGQEKKACNTVPYLPLCLSDISSMRNALPSHFKLIIIIIKMLFLLLT